MAADISVTSRGFGRKPVAAATRMPDAWRPGTKVAAAQTLKSGSHTADRLIYAIGDVHGRADLLDLLLQRIDQDRPSGVTPVLIFLGDYVDRGGESRAVIDRLLGLKREQIHEVRFLKGNHEKTMLDFTRQSSVGPVWLSYGGAETLFSYGVRAPAPGASAEDMRRASEALKAALPRDHLEFLKDLELFVRYGDYLFVHAGLKPGKPLDLQVEEDMLTIREPFMRSPRKWPFVVVHGHTPEPNVHVDDRRIGVDTGAYATGRLSAVRLEGENVTVLST
jgi:serine/threonine protein phosphatase 1